MSEQKVVDAMLASDLTRQLRAHRDALEQRRGEIRDAQDRGVRLSAPNMRAAAEELLETVAAIHALLVPPEPKVPRFERHLGTCPRFFEGSRLDCTCGASPPSMRSRAAITRELVESGIDPKHAQIEVLLDIRDLLAGGRR